MMKVNLHTQIAGINFSNPVLVASGTFGYGDETADLVDVSKIGGIITKTVTLEPRQGNPPPRIAEVTGGMLNAIGLQNVGLEKFISEKLPGLRKMKTKLIVSVAGETESEYIEIIKRLSSESGIAAFELNLSCPNLRKRIICADKKLVEDILRGVKNASKLPVIAKLSPNVEDIAETARAAKISGADALTVANTFTGMAIDVKTWKPKLANITGGMSGPAIKPMALRCVWEVCRNVDIPVIACGGIATAEDAVEFILAGARAVTVGTANFADPQSPVKIAAGIGEYLKKRKLESLSDIIGMMR
ncbi:MAG: dihydroorotate dehydrogenase [Elusimicrobiota bacterium]